MKRSGYATLALTEHFKQINPLEDGVTKLSEGVEDLANGALIYSVFSGEDDLIGVMGATEHPKGCYSFWAVPDKAAARHFMTYSRVTRALFTEIFDLHEVRRGQILVNEAFPWAHRWAEFLGMNFEGRLRKFGENGENHVIFAKVRE